MPIPIIFTVDVEPNEAFTDRSKPLPWTGFETGVRVTAGWRELVRERTGRPFCVSWFLRMDPQIEGTYGSPVWAAQTYRPLIDETLGLGDHWGIHTHAYRWDEGSKQWVIDHGNQKWVEHCIRMAFESYEKAFGKKAKTFRFGDRWMNNETMALLESLGVRCDLTPEPGFESIPTARGKRPFTGALPDYTRTPNMPYRPSREDFRVPGNGASRDLWTIPLSTGKTGLRLRFRRFFYRIFDPSKLEPINLILHLVLPPHLFRAIFETNLRKMEKPYFVFGMRSEIFLNASQMRTVRANLNYVLNHPRAKEFQFTEPLEALEVLGLT
jgi:hypothetical protein